MRLESIPLGYCQCGCGERTRLSPYSSVRYGWVKGQPRRFLHGHNQLKVPGTAGYEVRDCGYETPCWVWLRAMTDKGYGSIFQDGRRVPAHRVIYERFKEPIPDGLQIDHLCRNRACVNPDHLEPVTNAENTRRGLHTKLAPDDVAVIRSELLRGVTTWALAERFGVGETAIRNIKTNTTWR